MYTRNLCVCVCNLCNCLCARAPSAAREGRVGGVSHLPCVTHMCDTRKCDTCPPSQRCVRAHQKTNVCVSLTCDTGVSHVLCACRMCVAVWCSVVQCGAVCTLERVPSSLRTLSPTKRDIHAGVRESRGMRNIFSRHRCLNLPEVLGDHGGPWGTLGDPPTSPKHPAKRLYFQILAPKFKYMAPNSNI